MIYEQLSVEEQQAYDSKDLTFSFESNYKLCDIMEYLNRRYDIRFVPITNYELRKESLRCG